MRWYINDASIFNQIDDNNFGKLQQILWELVKLRIRYPILRDNLFVTRSLTHLYIKGGQSLVRMVERSSNISQKRGILNWFSKNGPFDHSEFEINEGEKFFFFRL